MSSEPTIEFTHHVRDRCLCLHVQRTARALARRFDDVFRPLGITQGQFSLLTALNRTAPPTMGDVAGLLALDRTTLTANLKPLVRRSLVKVKVDPRDRRSRRLHLTAAGRKVVAEAAPIWRRAHAQAERLLATTGADAVREALQQLC